LEVRRPTYRSDMDAPPGRIPLAVAHGARAARVALPDHLPVAELVAPLAQHLDVAPDGHPLHVRRVDGSTLDDGRSLREQGLLAGDLLVLESGAPGGPWVQDDLAHVVCATRRDEPDEEQSYDRAWQFAGWLLLTTLAAAWLADSAAVPSRWGTVAAALVLALATVLLGSGPVLAARFGGIDPFAEAALDDRPSRSAAGTTQAVRRARVIERRLTGAAALAIAGCAPPATASPALPAAALALNAAAALLLAGHRRRQTPSRWAARLEPLVTVAALPLAAWVALGSPP
jgi:hypothetical protein